MDCRLTSIVPPLGLLLFVTLGTVARADPVAVIPIRVSVEGGVPSGATGSYSGSVVEGGVLLGALRRLQQTDQYFKGAPYLLLNDTAPESRFTVREDPDHGPFLESVNGVAGGGRPQSYWELLSAGATGEYTRLDVGISCYKPKANEHIILRLSTWSKDV